VGHPRSSHHRLLWDRARLSAPSRRLVHLPSVDGYVSGIAHQIDISLVLILSYHPITQFSMAAESVYNLTVDDFCLRQFSPEYGGSKITMPPAEFEARVNAYYHANPHLADGYAPFCKHIFMPNFAGLTAGTAPITPENEHLLRSVYEARTEQELPVMVRALKTYLCVCLWFGNPSSWVLFHLSDEHECC